LEMEKKKKKRGEKKEKKDSRALVSCLRKLRMLGHHKRKRRWTGGGSRQRVQCDCREEGSKVKGTGLVCWWRAWSSRGIGFPEGNGEATDSPCKKNVPRGERGGRSKGGAWCRELDAAGTRQRREQFRAQHRFRGNIKTLWGIYWPRQSASLEAPGRSRADKNGETEGKIKGVLKKKEGGREGKRKKKKTRRPSIPSGSAAMRVGERIPGEKEKGRSMKFTDFGEVRAKDGPAGEGEGRHLLERIRVRGGIWVERSLKRRGIKQLTGGSGTRRGCKVYQGVLWQ